MSRAPFIPAGSSAKHRPPVSPLRHIRRPWAPEQAFCVGRALTGEFWPDGVEPTKRESCPRCWGKYVSTKERR